jgi:branched-chain amino acid aminotransferase
VRGDVVHLERHVARLLRDARTLGLGALEAESVRHALVSSALVSFPDREGVVRMEARPGPGGAELRATVREVGPEPPTWRAVLASEPHPGVSPWSTAKTSERAFYERALERAEAAGADEALLLDGAGFLVEGARASVVVVGADGRARTPPLARGGQAGIGRAILLERTPELTEADVALAELWSARELLAVNAVRGPRPILALDGRPVGTGAPGPWAARLAGAFAAG